MADPEDRQEGAEQDPEEVGDSADTEDEVDGSEEEDDDDNEDPDDPDSDPSDEDEEEEDNAGDDEEEGEKPDGDGKEARAKELTDRLAALEAKGKAAKEGTEAAPVIKPVAKPPEKKPKEEAKDDDVVEGGIFSKEDLTELEELVSPKLAEKLKQLDKVLKGHADQFAEYKTREQQDLARQTARTVIKWLDKKSKAGFSEILGVSGKLSDTQAKRRKAILDKACELQTIDPTASDEDVLEMALIKFMATEAKPGKKPMKQAIQSSVNNRTVPPGRTGKRSPKDAKAEALAAASKFYQ